MALRTPRSPVGITSDCRMQASNRVTQGINMWAARRSSMLADTAERNMRKQQLTAKTEDKLRKAETESHEKRKRA